MSTARYAVLNLILILISAPWFFIGEGKSTELGGFPLWAVYCLCVAAVYAVFVAFSLSLLWKTEEGDHD